MPIRVPQVPRGWEIKSSRAITSKGKTNELGLLEPASVDLDADCDTPIVDLNGMGADTLIKWHRWLNEPDSRVDAFGRPFELSQVISLSAQTGLEWSMTAY